MLIWLVRPPGDLTTPEQRQALSEFRQLVRSEGTVPDEVRTTDASLGQGRSAALLDPADAARLYQTLHKAAVAVFTVVGAYVQLRPHERPHPRTVQPIGAFVRHKAAHVHISRPGRSNQAWGDAVSQLAALGWNDTNDARLLPMHCFDARCTFDLSDPTGRQQFEDAHRRRDHGPGHQRRWHWVNNKGHEWAPAKARHALEPLTIARRGLPPGMHWDTKLGKTREFSNGWEVWDTDRTAYINVAPNAHIRASGAQKIWDAVDRPRPPARTPQAGRRRAGTAARSRRAKYPVE